ncbi:T9SS type A sorting domain-containing protein [Segetibacter sp. 3557_3]|uniref:T9SS type A sorting domain-containing protein n=1 Tax=Segetibacter sp. 3557_3 TaxID=2547429 RepID=UPI001059154C|nr:T9SS type A sorting domain-containing protein [Segetibacter sp. 3557_3]TDH24600.1 T9SS type A sorting domain-containing protein [Segetibacter sp. 3557_3]
MKQLITFLACCYSFCLAAQPGSLDPTFGNGGQVITTVGTYRATAHAMAIQSDGKIIVGGTMIYANSSRDFALVRYNLNGSLDSSFDGDGIVITAVQSGDVVLAVEIQTDGKIVAAGGNVLARYNLNGSLDMSFGVGGRVIETTDGSANALTIQSDGKLVLAGNRNSRFLVRRYHSNGGRDLTFDGDGESITSFGFNSWANAIAIQNDGKIIAAGIARVYYIPEYTSLAVARYNTNGSLDTTFNGDGKFTGMNGTTPSTIIAEAKSIAIDPDGKIVVGGSGYAGRFGLARLNTNGSLDATFSGGAVVTQMGSGHAEGKAVAISPDGKIFLAGSTVNLFALAKYNRNGNLDLTFGNNGKVIMPAGQANAMKINASRIYLAGSSRPAGSNYDQFSIVAYQNSGQPLPLTLTNLSVSLDKTSALCRWQTTGEINTSHFIIQRSIDGTSFSDMGRVDANGRPTSYDFKDVLSSTYFQLPIVYYRLQIIDTDGKFTYSPIAILKPKQKKLFTIFPNPAHAFIQIIGSNLQSAEVMDDQGRLLLQNNITGQSNKIKVTGLLKGSYYVRITDRDGNVQTEKLVIQ